MSSAAFPDIEAESGLTPGDRRERNTVSSVDLPERWDLLDDERSCRPG